jgi:uncharacterized protein
MSCQEHDEMDVVVQIRKMDKNGHLLTHVNYPVDQDNVPDTNVVKYLGPSGFLRASHRHTLDSSQSIEVDKVYLHNSRQPVPVGTIVPLEITLWPMGMVFGPGEGIVLRISGHNMTLPEAPPCILGEPDDQNQGHHTVHTGGEYDSHLMLPILPKEW